MKKRMVRITGCLLAGALSIGSFGLNTYAAPVAGVSSVTAVEIAEGQTPAAGVSQALAQCLADSNDAAAQKAAEQAEQVSENDTPVVASEYTDIAIAQVDNYVNVRSEPNTDSEVLGKLYNNSAGTILETTDNGWYRIKSGNVDGYVKCEYVVPNDEELAKRVSTKYAKVNTTTLHVRTEPSTDASILTQVPVGDDLVVIDDESVEDWAKVTTEEGDGWVHKDYVDLGQTSYYPKVLSGAFVEDIYYGFWSNHYLLKWLIKNVFPRIFIRQHIPGNVYLEPYKQVVYDVLESKGFVLLNK